MENHTQSIEVSQFSHLPSPFENEDRQSANFHPTVWGDYFINKPPMPPSELALLKDRHDELMVEVKKMIANATDPFRSLELIDRIQRLGVAYLFEKEIHDELNRNHKTSIDENDLYAVSLHFRLLRQQRYHVPCDVFNKFLDENGEFIASLSDNVQALLSLYEAAYLCMPGEVILEKALKFTKGHLKSLECSLEPHLAMMVKSSLEVPLVRRVDRTKTKLYLTIYDKDILFSKILLDFAKLDFLLLQAMHQEEVRSLSIWWKGLGLKEILPFIRDRMVECYFWILSIYFEPCYSRARVMMSKVIKLTSILDDIFDNYGTIGELQLLTDIIDCWELENVTKLPKYIQHAFLAIYNTFKSFEEELFQEQNSFRVKYLIEALKRSTKAYFQEAKWASDGYVANLKDHLNVTLVSAGYLYLTCASYIGMREVIAKDLFEWVINMPPMIRSSSVIGRVMNDISSYEFEHKRKHVASSVQCYAVDHGCLEEEACMKLMEMVEEEWKIINREFTFSEAPMALMRTIINLANFSELVYKDKDLYSHAEEMMKDYINSVLVENILM